MLVLLTNAVRFVAESEDLPERHPVAPDVRLDVELPGLEVLSRHPGPGDHVALGLLVICQTSGDYKLFPGPFTRQEEEELFDNYLDCNTSSWTVRSP